LHTTTSTSTKREKYVNQSDVWKFSVMDAASREPKTEGIPYCGGTSTIMEWPLYLWRNKHNNGVTSISVEEQSQ
jgi:hypothetical protein